MPQTNGDTDSAGNILRRERERRKLSLADVQAVTGISAENLVALEEERFDVFPNRVYTRAFLRDYANYLDLDSGSLLDIYERNWANPALDIFAARDEKSAEAIHPVAHVLAVCILLAIALLVFWKPGYNIIHRALRPTPAVTAPKQPAPQASREEPAASPASPEPAAVSGVELAVLPTRPVWMRVTVDGERVFENVLPAGKQVTWRAVKVVSYRVGDAGAVRLTVNGKQTPQPGPSGEVAEGEFTAASATESVNPPSPASLPTSPP